MKIDCNEICVVKECAEEVMHVCKYCVRNKLVNESPDKLDDYFSRFQESGY